MWGNRGLWGQETDMGSGESGSHVLIQCCVALAEAARRSCKGGSVLIVANRFADCRPSVSDNVVLTP